jgi:hypothetical protein
MAKIKYGVMLDIADLDALFNKLKLIKYKKYITYLPNLNPVVEGIIKYFYEQGFEYGIDFNHLTNSEGNTIQITLTKWDKELVFWSFETATSSKWRDWLKIEPQMDEYKFLAIVDRMRAMGFKTMTSSMSCWNMWKYGDKDKKIPSQTYYDKEFPHIIDNKQLDYINNSYRGGIIRVQKDYVNKDVKTDLVVVDVNSMYSHMMKQPYPHGEPKFYKTMTAAQLDGYEVGIHKVWVKKAKIKPGLEPFIQFQHEISYNYDYPEQFEDRILYLWTIELRQFALWYDVEYQPMTYDVLAFKTRVGSFDAYINYWKQEKDRTKIQNDKVGHMIAKVALNSLYGKFGSKAIHDNIVYDYKDGTIRRRYTTTIAENKYYRAFASYITAKARAKLILAIQENAERFIYCDTDSIYLQGRKKPELDIDNKKMGAWKIVGYYTRIAIRAPKYLIKQSDTGELERVMAGTVEHKAASITFENILQP